MSNCSIYWLTLDIKDMSLQKRSILPCFWSDYQRRAGLLVPWLVWHMVLPILAIISLIWSFVILIYDWPGSVTNTAIVIIVFIFLSLGKWQKSLTITNVLNCGLSGTKYLFTTNNAQRSQRLQIFSVTTLFYQVLYIRVTVQRI
jgi:hypothetical protein